jgi:hypothetical protein
MIDSPQSKVYSPRWTSSWSRSTEPRRDFSPRARGELEGEGEWEEETDKAKLPSLHALLIGYLILLQVMIGNLCVHGEFFDLLWSTQPQLRW